jgi:hypothetical protein
MESRAGIKAWNLNETHYTEAQNLLESLTRNEKNSISLECSKCTSNDTQCNCSMTKIRIENSFDVFVILQSEKNSATQSVWCPLQNENSSFFHCSFDNPAEKIRSEQICDSQSDCMDNSDESDIVCHSRLMKIFLAGALSGIIAMASGLVVCSICKKGKKKTKIGRNGINQSQMINVMVAIAEFLKNATASTEEKMKQAIKKTPRKTQIRLMLASRNVTVKRKEKSGRLFKPAVKHTFDSTTLRKPMLQMVKNTQIATTLKKEIFEELQPGLRTRLKNYMDKKLNTEFRLISAVVISTLSEISSLVSTTLLQEWKDLTTILSIYVFYNDVLQMRITLIGRVS